MKKKTTKKTTKKKTTNLTPYMNRARENLEQLRRENNAENLRKIADSLEQMRKENNDYLGNIENVNLNIYGLLKDMNYRLMGMSENKAKRKTYKKK